MASSMFQVWILFLLLFIQHNGCYSGEEKIECILFDGPRVLCGPKVAIPPRVGCATLPRLTDLVETEHDSQGENPNKSQPRSKAHPESSTCSSHLKNIVPGFVGWPQMFTQNSQPSSNLAHDKFGADSEIPCFTTNSFDLKTVQERAGDLPRTTENNFHNLFTEKTPTSESRKKTLPYSFKPLESLLKIQRIKINSNMSYNSRSPMLPLEIEQCAYMADPETNNNNLKTVAKSESEKFLSAFLIDNIYKKYGPKSYFENKYLIPHSIAGASSPKKHINPRYTQHYCNILLKPATRSSYKFSTFEWPSEFTTITPKHYTNNKQSLVGLQKIHKENGLGKKGCGRYGQSHKMSCQQNYKGHDESQWLRSANNGFVQPYHMNVRNRYENYNVPTYETESNRGGYEDKDGCGKPQPLRVGSHVENYNIPTRQKERDRSAYEDSNRDIVAHQLSGGNRNEKHNYPIYQKDSDRVRYDSNNGNAQLHHLSSENLRNHYNVPTHQKECDLSEYEANHAYASNNHKSGRNRHANYNVLTYEKESGRVVYDDINSYGRTYGLSGENRNDYIHFPTHQKEFGRCSYKDNYVLVQPYDVSSGIRADYYNVPTHQKGNDFVGYKENRLSTLHVSDGNRHDNHNGPTLQEDSNRSGYNYNNGEVQLHHRNGGNRRVDYHVPIHQKEGEHGGYDYNNGKFQPHYRNGGNRHEDYHIKIHQKESDRRSYDYNNGEVQPHHGNSGNHKEDYYVPIHQNESDRRGYDYNNGEIQPDDGNGGNLDSNGQNNVSNHQKERNRGGYDDNNGNVQTHDVNGGIQPDDYNFATQSHQGRARNHHDDYSIAAHKNLNDRVGNQNKDYDISKNISGYTQGHEDVTKTVQNKQTNPIYEDSTTGRQSDGIKIEIGDYKINSPAKEHSPSRENERNWNNNNYSEKIDNNENSKATYINGLDRTKNQPTQLGNIESNRNNGNSFGQRQKERDRTKNVQTQTIDSERNTKNFSKFNDQQNKNTDLINNKDTKNEQTPTTIEKHVNNTDNNKENMRTSNKEHYSNQQDKNKEYAHTFVNSFRKRNEKQHISTEPTQSKGTENNSSTNKSFIKNKTSESTDRTE